MARAQAALKAWILIPERRLRAVHKSWAICMPSQVSGLEPKALESLIAISTEIPALSFTRSDRACRVTPSDFAALVTERPSGSRHWRRTRPPGWGGACIPAGFLMVVFIVDIHRMLVFEAESHPPISGD